MCYDRAFKRKEMGSDANERRRRREGRRTKPQNACEDDLFIYIYINTIYIYV